MVVHDCMETGVAISCTLWAIISLPYETKIDLLLYLSYLHPLHLPHSFCSFRFCGCVLSTAEFVETDVSSLQVFWLKTSGIKSDDAYTPVLGEFPVSLSFSHSSCPSRPLMYAFKWPF